MVTLASRCSNLCKDKNFWSVYYRHLHVVEILIFSIGGGNIREINKKCHFKIVFANLNFLSVCYVLFCICLLQPIYCAHRKHCKVKVNTA
jgi:hypothetical protein